VFDRAGCHPLNGLRGVTFVKRKAVRVTARTGDRLTRFLFDRNEPPPSQDMTIVITGVAEENLFSADLFMGSHEEGTVISVNSLHQDISRLLSGTTLGGVGRRNFPPGVPIVAFVVGRSIVLSRVVGRVNGKFLENPQRRPHRCCRSCSVPQMSRKSNLVGFELESGATPAPLPGLSVLRLSSRG